MNIIRKAISRISWEYSKMTTDRIRTHARNELRAYKAMKSLQFLSGEKALNHSAIEVRCSIGGIHIFMRMRTSLHTHHFCWHLLELTWFVERIAFLKFQELKVFSLFLLYRILWSNAGWVKFYAIHALRSLLVLTRSQTHFFNT